MNRTKIKSRVWLSILIFGLFGQLAWVIENMYFNVYLYNTVTGDPNAIATMVAASAIVATLTTLFMGALSDKLGKRKIFITYGYIIWGIVTGAFAFITTENTAKLFPALPVVSTTVAMIVIMDCIMTFFGSTANDAAFNAWVTDVTDHTNRGRVETVLSALPLLAMLVVFGGLDPLTQKGNWKLFYLIIGGLVTAGGLVGMLLIKDQPQLQANNGNYVKNIFYGFKPSTFKQNKSLYLSFVTFAILNIAYQIFMPYIIIYIQLTLKIKDYALPLGAILILAALISVLCGSVMDKIGKHRFMIPCTLVLITGFVIMYFVTGDQLALLIIGGSIMMGANLLVSSSVSGTIRDYTPDDKVGLFQGIRMIFAVLLPMVTGPYIGAAVIGQGGETYEELGLLKQVPTPNIFLAAAAVTAIAIIPMIWLWKKGNKRQKETTEKNKTNK